MANEYQDSIIKAVDYLIENRINDLSMDKTVVATVKKIDNAVANRYVVSYNGGEMYAYCQEGAVYSENQTVYVLVPQNDFSQRKMIIGSASAVGENNNLSYVSSAMEGYNRVGGDAIVEKPGKFPVGVSSFLATDALVIYDRSLNDNYVTINDSELRAAIEKSKALYLSSTFQTSKIAGRMRKGNYGIVVSMSFKTNETDASGQPVLKQNSYVLDTRNMVGDPRSYTYKSEQYATFDLTGEEFVSVDQIILFWESNDGTDDLISYDLYGDDIFSWSVSLYGLEELTSTSNGYTLSISQPEGMCFARGGKPSDTLSAVARLTYNGQDLTQSATFYWYKFDARVNSTSKYYNAYGGSGWQYDEERYGHSNMIQVTRAECQAYQNRYLCVCEYKQQILLKYGNSEDCKFLFVNEDASLDIKITTYPGTDLVYSTTGSGLKVVCTVNDKTVNFTDRWSDNYEYDDAAHSHRMYEYTCFWERIVEGGTSYPFGRTIPSIEQRRAEYKKEYDSVPASPVGEKLAAKKKYEAQIALLSIEENNLRGISLIDSDADGPHRIGNAFNYALKEAPASVTFRCSIYRRLADNSADAYTLRGTASITINNSAAKGDQQQYRILLKNGDQVFQYSEAGIAPTNHRYAEPQVVEPLSVFFFDPDGRQISPMNYNVKWILPIKSSMLDFAGKTLLDPIGNLDDNGDPIDDTYRWLAGSRSEGDDSYTLPFGIKDPYNYSAVNNQIKIEVNYEGSIYTESTNFTFTKIGENGTNGTDVFCKITADWPKSDELPIIDVYKGGRVDVPTMHFSLYRSGILDESADIAPTWGISGTPKRQPDASGMMSVPYTKPITSINTNSGQVSLTLGKPDFDSQSGRYNLNNQVIKAEYKEADGQAYYAFYPMPIAYCESESYRIRLDRDKTLKSILYNSDGRSPLYNSNLGISYHMYNSSGDELAARCVWSTMGGASNNATTSALNISLDGKSFTKGDLSTTGTFIYVKPDDVYDGEYCNNCIHGRFFLNNTFVGDIYVPIHMSLNRYGLSSLNAWDGNHIDINEDESYILAPQIGAGVKNSDNSFTGIVMGKTVTYDKTTSGGELVPDQSVGLLGYSSGKQSILLDAETGNATFGLPENNASAGNRYTEGRIELIPGGTSKIGTWNIGSRSLFNMNTYDGTQSPFSVVRDSSGDIRRVEYDESKDNPISVAPGKPYKEYPVLGSQISVPERAQGIILNAAPAYVSVKGMPLNENNCDIDWNGANTTLQQGDSLEVEIDPKKGSLFSIYRHTRWKDGVQGSESRRYPLVGINAYGQFYTNAIEDGDSSMGIGPVGAFGTNAGGRRYFGATFGYKTKNIFKFFIDDKSDGSEESKPLFITAGSSIDDEYARPLSMNFKSVGMYAYASAKPDDEAAKLNKSDHKLEISMTEANFGHFSSSDKNYLKIPSGSTNLTELVTQNALSVSTAKGGTTSIGGNSILTVGGTSSVSVGGFFDSSIASNQSVKRVKVSSSQRIETDENSSGYAVGIFDLDSSGNSVSPARARVKLTNASALLESSASASLALNNSSASTLKADKGLSVLSKNNKIELVSGIVESNSITSVGSNIESRTYGGQIHLRAYGSGTNWNTKGYCSVLLTPESTQGHGKVNIQGGGTTKVAVGDWETVKDSKDAYVETVNITPGISTKFINITEPDSGVHDNYALYVRGKTNLKGSVELGDTFNVDGTVTFGSTLAVSGEATFKDKVTAEKDVEIKGICSIRGKNDSGHALWIENGGITIDKAADDGNAISVWSGDINAPNNAVKANFISVGGKDITKSWLDEIQRLYNSWDKTNTFPLVLTSDLVTSLINWGAVNWQDFSIFVSREAEQDTFNSIFSRLAALEAKG